MMDGFLFVPHGVLSDSSDICVLRAQAIIFVNEMRDACNDDAVRNLLPTDSETRAALLKDDKFNRFKEARDERIKRAYDVIEEISFKWIKDIFRTNHCKGNAKKIKSIFTNVIDKLHSHLVCELGHILIKVQIDASEEESVQQVSSKLVAQMECTTLLTMSIDEKKAIQAELRKANELVQSIVVTANYMLGDKIDEIVGVKNIYQAKYMIYLK